jgi:hypothetical protein
VIFKFLTLAPNFYQPPHHLNPPNKVDRVGKKNWLIKVGFHNFMLIIIPKKIKKNQQKNKKDVINNVSKINLKNLNGEKNSSYFKFMSNTNHDRDFFLTKVKHLTFFPIYLIYLIF